MIQSLSVRTLVIPAVLVFSVLTFQCGTSGGGSDGGTGGGGASSGAGGGSSSGSGGGSSSGSGGGTPSGSGGGMAGGAGGGMAGGAGGGMAGGAGGGMAGGAGGGVAVGECVVDAVIGPKGNDAKQVESKASVACTKRFPKLELQVCIEEIENGMVVSDDNCASQSGSNVDKIPAQSKSLSCNPGVSYRTAATLSIDGAKQPTVRTADYTPACQ
jgi:hypothetical protein